jgi:hypothetical protein
MARVSVENINNVFHVHAVVDEKIKDLSFFFSFKRVKGRDSKQDGLDG